MWNFLQQQLFVLLVFLFSNELISVLNRRSVLQHRKPICKDIADPIRYHGTVEADGTLIETSNGTLTINGTLNGTSKTKKKKLFEYMSNILSNNLKNDITKTPWITTGLPPVYHRHFNYFPVLPPSATGFPGPAHGFPPAFYQTTLPSITPDLQRELTQ